MLLTVSDVERLAKAGVTVAFEDIATQLGPDLPRDHLDPLARAVMDRWMRNPRNRERCENKFTRIHMSAVGWGDMVYVFVATGRNEPVVLTDDMHMFPSDALMAKLHLLEHQPV